MWRRNNLPGSTDSTQSISEEEDEEEHINVDFGGNDKSPSRNTTEEGGLLLQTKLEKLIGRRELNHGGETGDVSLEATPEVPSSLDDVVEVPDSPEESYFGSLRRDRSTRITAEENVSDDEIPQEESMATWSTVSKETMSLMHSNGIDSVSISHSSGFRTKRGSKVVKRHVRPKFSFQSHTHGETSSKITAIAENFELDDQTIEEDPIAECEPGFDDEMAENRQDISLATLKKVSACQDSATDDELPGPMDNGSSSDNELSYQISVPNTSNQTKQFVGDRLNEALKASSVNKEGLLHTSPKLSGGSSLYEKLQQIMKQEKETEIEIIKKLQTDSTNYVDVRIISRNFEAKLVVCKCYLMNLPKESILFNTTQALEDKESERTIIFNPRVCADVEIEIGSLIRLYEPWKEVEVKKSKEVIMLCSYFSTM